MLSLLLIGVVVNSFLHGGSESSLNPIATAAERMEKVQGVRFSLEFVYSTPAFTQPIVASGSGEANAETNRSRATLEMSNPLTGEPVHIVTIDDGKYQYTSGDTVADELTPGKKWVRTPSEANDDENPMDMEDALNMLSTSGGVKLIGHEAIDGRMTSRYHGEIQIGDFVDYLQGKGKDNVAAGFERVEEESSAQISAETWVDGKSMMRRLRLVMPTPGEPGKAPVTIDMRMDFLDYTVHPDIQLPNPGSVVDGPVNSDAAPTSSSIN